jgi:hypothetical protein
MICLNTNNLFSIYFVQNDVESIRLNTKEYEMIVAQHGNFTIVVTHSNIKQEAKPGEGGEKKDGEPEAKKEG